MTSPVSVAGGVLIAAIGAISFISPDKTYRYKNSVKMTPKTDLEGKRRVLYRFVGVISIIIGAMVSLKGAGMI